MRSINLLLLITTIGVALIAWIRISHDKKKLRWRHQTNRNLREALDDTRLDAGLEHAKAESAERLAQNFHERAKTDRMIRKGVEELNKRIGKNNWILRKVIEKIHLLEIGRASEGDLLTAKVKVLN